MIGKVTSVTFVASVLIASVAIFQYRTRSSIYHCEVYQLPSPPELKGPLAVNDILVTANFIVNEHIFGPESIIVEGDTIYASTQNGSVIMLANNGILNRISNFNVEDSKYCDGSFYTEPICGRPLGLRRLNDDEIVAIDSYLGIFVINYKTGQHRKIMEKEMEVDGVPIMFPNDVDVIDEDLIIFTDASPRWARRMYMISLLEGVPNGRVLSLQPSSGAVSVVLGGLYFANGIQLFPDKKSFLVAETLMARIKRHWIAGPKKGETEIFSENLPGFPDNIRAGINETFWVALAITRHSEKFSLLDYLGNKPNLRNIVLQLVPAEYWEALVTKFRARHSMVIQLNAKGEIISSAHDPFGSVISDITQVTETDDHLYLGSLSSKFIARVKK